LVAPVVRSGHILSHMAETTVWLPPGCWFDVVLGALRCSSNGTMYSASYDMSEIPRFVRGNAVLIASSPNVLGAAPLSTLELDVFPDGSDGVSEAVLYEDDGVSTEYADSGTFSRSTVSFEACRGNFTLELGPPFGAFAVLPKSLVIRLYNVLTPASLNCSAPCAWRFDALRMATEIVVAQPVNRFVLTYTPMAGPSVNGISGRIRRAQLAKQALDSIGRTPGSHVPVRSFLSEVAALPQLLEQSSHFVAALQGFDALWRGAVVEVRGLEFHPVVLPRWPYAYGLVKDV
jgi:hypothetical protein